LATMRTLTRVPTRIASVARFAPANKCSDHSVQRRAGAVKPSPPSRQAQRPLLWPFLARCGLRFPVSARRYRLQVPFIGSVSGGKNPVPNSAWQERTGGIWQRSVRADTTTPHGRLMMTMLAGRALVPIPKRSANP
jgi:hypothetical protein